MLTVTELAKELRVSRQTIYNKCKVYGIQLEDYVVATDGHSRLLSAEGAAAIRKAVRWHPGMPEIDLENDNLEEQPDSASDPEGEPDPETDPSGVDPDPADEDPVSDPEPAKTEPDPAALARERDQLKIQLLEERIRDLKQQIAADADRESRLLAQIENLTMSLQAATMTSIRLASETSKAEAARPGLMTRIRRLFHGAGKSSDSDNAGSEAEPAAKRKA